MNPLVSIVTINYNEPDSTSELIYSLNNLTYKNVEIIVVDNNSTRGNIEKALSPFTNVKLIKNSENIGFAGGNNLGIKESNGEYIMLLNNDAVGKKDFLEPMIDLMEHDSTIGMVSPKIKYFQDRDIIQFAGYTKLNPITMRNSAFGYHKKDGIEYYHVSESPYCHGAAVLVRKSALKEAGPMPEGYFLYFEELDWSMRMKEAGYKIMVQPKSEVYHKASLATGATSPLKTFYMFRNRILFMLRNSKSNWLKGISLSFHLIIVLPKEIIVNLFHYRTENISALFKATIWLVKNVNWLKLQPSISE